MAERTTPLTPEEKERFERFLFEMDDVIEEFVQEAQSKKFHLDFSLDSVDLLEEYWASFGDGMSNERLLNRFARYLGEVFRNEIGGAWKLCNKGSRYLFDKLPIVCDYATNDIEYCPIEVFRNFVITKRPGTLRKSVEAHRQFRSSK